MRKKYLLYRFLYLITASLGWVNFASAQEREIPKETYIAATIPDSLKLNANSVVRYSETNVLVKGPGRETLKHHSIVTILNEKGDKAAIMVLGYNRKYDNFSNIEMRVYNEAGTLIKKYHKGDMYDGLASDDITLVSDDRILGVRHAVATYPTTVETEYEENISSLIEVGSWHIQNEEQAVQNSYFSILIDSAAGFRYSNKNIAIKPKRSTVDKLNSYEWQVSGLRAFKIEEGAEAWNVLPRIYFASSNFTFYGLPGDFSSWASFGKWIRALNADVSSLTPQREEEIRKMTDTFKTDKDKARFLYKYMQRSMRYVSIQLGIGGLKPFSATFVDQKKYGDCKALSNYMYALLKAVNIPSCYAIVNAQA
ncbi:MAG: DUF3857 domain-containing protein, partial [Bacteroidota bacterium]|nr:DUF3857 domain-containing protein [Bacteroidota bacterium]